MNTQNIYIDDLLQVPDDNAKERLHDIMQDERYTQIFENHGKNAKVTIGSMKFRVSEIGRSLKPADSEKYKKGDTA